MKTVIFAVFIAATFTGCSHTCTVAFDEGKARGDVVAVNTVNRRLADKSVVLVRRDSTEYPVSGIFLSRDLRCLG